MLTPRYHSLVLILAIAAVAILSKTEAATSTGQDRLPDGPGKVTVESLCATRCHGPSMIMKARRTPAGWETILDKMLERGAEMSDSEYDTILEYLSQRLLATVNVNTAAAERLVEVLEISEKEAAALVEGRKKHGLLKTWEDVAKLSGADPKLIEERKARLVFDPPAA